MRPLGWFGLLAAGCGSSVAPSPFEDPAQVDAGSEVGAEAAPDVEQLDADDPDGPALGGPCTEDAQCDDQVGCTFDHCDDELGRCRFEPDDAWCADDVYCNGIERCEPSVGCVPGEPISCSDGSACTINRCVESERSCESLPRDADGDGDPDARCGDGGDCNDADPWVSSLMAEICANGKDDDCDGQTDEPECEHPAYDVCAAPLLVEAPGSYSLSLAAAQGDYAASCASGGEQWRDVVLAVVVENGPVDVDVVVTTQRGELALAAGEQCGDAATELACSEAFEPPDGGKLARLYLRSLPDGTYPVYLFGRAVDVLSLGVDFLPPTLAPTHETCGTALELVPERLETVVLVDAELDVSGACEPAMGDLFYQFVLDEVADVRVSATSLDGLGLPSLSLRSSACSGPEDELTCRTSDPADLFARALAPGSYFLAVSATSPTEMELLLRLESPSEAPADERCAEAPLLEHDTTVDVPLYAHTDDHHVGCLAGAADAAYELVLERVSDVRLVQRISAGDTGGVSLVRPPCGGSADLVACGVASRSPVRTSARRLEPGSYRVLGETVAGNPTQLTALVRPAAPAVLVAFADTCADAIEIGESGGLFQGNTANASSDYEAGCDAGGSSTESAPDQMLRLSLSRTRRVILDMQGSAYRTLLDVRRGPSCPGTEVWRGCSAGYDPDRSYLDLVLEAGDYFIQVDGYAGAAGAWLLDVHVID